MPGLDGALVESVVRLVGRLRELRLRKAPSVSETVDWARTLLALGTADLTAEVLRDNLGVLLGTRTTSRRAAKALDL